MVSSTVARAILFALLATSASAQSGRPSAYSPAPRDAPQQAPFAVRVRKPQLQKEELVPLQPSPGDNRFALPVASPRVAPAAPRGPVAPPAPSYFTVTPSPVFQQPTLFPTLFPLDPSIAALFGLPASPGAGQLGSSLLLAPPAPAPALAPAAYQQAPQYAAQQPGGALAAPQQNVIYANELAPTAPPPALLPPLLTLPPSFAALLGLPTYVGGGVAAPQANVAPARVVPSGRVAFGAPIVSPSQASQPEAPSAFAAPISPSQAAPERNGAIVADQVQPGAVLQAAPPQPLFSLPPASSVLAALFGAPTAVANGAPLPPPNAADAASAPSAPNAFAAPVQSAPNAFAAPAPSSPNAFAAPAPSAPTAFAAPTFQLPQLSVPFALPSLFPQVAAPVKASAKN